MNDPGTWQPSHRRSTITGEIQDSFTEVVVMPEVSGPPDDKPAPEPIESSRAEVVRELGAFLEDGPPWSMAVRLAALKYHWRMSDLSQREAAEKAGCALPTLNRTIRQVERYFQRRTGEKMEHPPHV
jgi:hypothetical protein